jgi:hypothetical protein
MTVPVSGDSCKEGSVVEESGVVVIAATDQKECCVLMLSI